MEQVSNLLHSNAETFEKKTTDYGESWRKIGDILLSLSNGDPIVLETQEDFVAFGLYTRRLDKFARAFHGEFVADEMNFEAVRDSHEDESVYAAMHAVNQGLRKTDSSEDENSFRMAHPTTKVND